MVCRLRAEFEDGVKACSLRRLAGACRLRHAGAGRGLGIAGLGTVGSKGGETAASQARDGASARARPRKQRALRALLV